MPRLTEAIGTLYVQIINSSQFISGALLGKQKTNKQKNSHYIKLHCLSGKNGEKGVVLCSYLFHFFLLKTNYSIKMWKDSSLQHIGKFVSMQYDTFKSTNENYSNNQS